MPANVELPIRLKPLFAAIDAKDTSRFVDHLSENAVFRFGSAPPVHGRSAIATAVTAFFDSIAGCRHAISSTWSSPGKFACEGEVCYTRHDGSEITLPFVDVFELQGELISGYRIYIDIAPLYTST